MLAPGNVFSPSGTWGDYLRFNVVMSDDDRVSAGAHQLAGEHDDSVEQKPRPESFQTSSYND